MPYSQGSIPCRKRIRIMLISLPEDFSPAKIANSGQCFRAALLPDGYWRFITGRHLLYLKEENPERKPGLYRVSCRTSTWEKIWKPYFDLDTDYAAIRSMVLPDDRFLREAAEYGRGIRILRQDPWEMLITFILSQRKSIPAIRAAVEALCKTYGSPLADTAHPAAANSSAICAFPTPRQMRHATARELNACRLGYRTPYVLDAIRQVNSGRLDPAALPLMDTPALMDALMSIKGIGIKVAGCVALFACHRTELAPVDTWIRQIIDKHYQGADPFSRYGQYAGILQQYAFYYAVSHKSEIRISGF